MDPITAIDAFSKNGDLLYCVGQQVNWACDSNNILLLTCLQINNRKLLLNLCLVSKCFNKVFSVFLYKELWFCERNYHWLFQEDRLSLLLANERLKHVKALSFAAYQDTYQPLYKPFFGPGRVVLCYAEISEFSFLSEECLIS